MSSSARFLVGMTFYFAATSTSLGANYFRIGDCFWRIPNNVIVHPTHKGLDFNRLTPLPMFEGKEKGMLVFYDVNYSEFACAEQVGNMCLLDKPEKNGQMFLYSEESKSAIGFSGFKIDEVNQLYTGLCEYQ